MVTGLIVTLQEKKNVTLFIDTLKQVASSLCSDKKAGKTDKAWRNRLSNLTLQLCRAYPFFTSAERLSFCEAVTPYMEKGSLNLAKMYSSINEEDTEAIVIRPMMVTPRWGQSHLQLRDMSTTHIAEQLTFFEAQLHHQVCLGGCCSVEYFSNSFLA